MSSTTIPRSTSNGTASANRSAFDASVSWFHRPETTLALFAAISLVCYIDRFIIGALLTPIKVQLGLSDEQLGQLNVVFVFAYIAIVPISGFLGDRFARKWYIFLSLIVWSLASIGSGLAATFGTLMIWRSLVGVGEGVFASLSPSWIADTFGPKRRAIAFAVIQSMSQLAAWMSYHFGGKIAAESGWQHAFFVAGAPGLALVLFVIFLREPKRGAADNVSEVKASKPKLREIGQLLKQANYLLYVAGFTIRMLAVSGLFFWGAVYLHREYGVANKEATSFVGLAYFVAGLPGIFIGGILAGRLARKIRGAYASWLVAGEILAGLCVATVLLVIKDLAVAKWVLLAQMFFAGNSWGVINPLLFELAPIRLRSSAVSIAITISTGGSALLSSQLIGYVSDQVGIQKALLLVPAGYFIAAALWLTLAIRQRRQLGRIGNGSPATALPEPVAT